MPVSVQGVLSSGHRFDTGLALHRHGRYQVAMARAASRDPIVDATSVQLLLTINGDLALGKTLRVEGRACDAVFDFGPGFGGGKLVLHWALMPEKGGMIAYGHGSWNDLPLEEFAHKLFARPTGQLYPADERAFGALRLDSGGFADPGAGDPEMIEALSGFASRPNAEPESSLEACLASATHCLVSAAAEPPRTGAPALPAAVKRCAILESTALVACALRD